MRLGELVWGRSVPALWWCGGNGWTPKEGSLLKSPHASSMGRLSVKQAMASLQPHLHPLSGAWSWGQVSLVLLPPPHPGLSSLGSMGPRHSSHQLAWL